MPRHFAPALIAIAVFAPPVFAVEDAATGLKIDLPADFIVKPAPGPTQGYDVMFGIDTVSGTPPIIGNSPNLCNVAYTAATRNADLSQAEINDMISAPEWGEQARAAMARAMDFESTETFTLAGATGAEFVAIPKAGPDHQNVRIIMSMLETPKGRTVVTCVATATTLKKALPVFHRIRDGVTPPS